HEPQGGDGDDQAGVGSKLEQALVTGPAARRIGLEGDGEDHRDEKGDAEGDERARPAQLLGQLGAEDSEHDPQPSPTMPRKASSSWWRAVTVSTPTPACTRAATSSERVTPSISRASPGGSGTTRRTPFSFLSVDVARRTFETSRYTEPLAPMRSWTGPAATSLPLSMTTACVHTCSTSVSRWLDKSTVAPSSETRRSSWRTSRISPGSSPLVGSSSTS